MIELAMAGIEEADSWRDCRGNCPVTPEFSYGHEQHG
jgi:hypothetical protein